MMHRTLTPTLALVLIAGWCGAQTAPPPANPLDPLGGGRVLDANSSTTRGRINNQVYNFQAMVRYNEALVNGTASGGRSLRVPLGYGDSQVRNSTSTFAFNRDALSPQVSVQAARDASGLGFAGSNRLNSAYREPLGAPGGAGTFGRSARQSPLSEGQPRQALAASAISPLSASARAARLVEGRADGRSGLLVGLNTSEQGITSTVRASALRGLVYEPIDLREDNRLTSGGERPSREGERDERTIEELSRGPTALVPGTAQRPLTPFSSPGAGSGQIAQAREGFTSAMRAGREARMPAITPGTRDEAPKPLTPEEIDAQLDNMRARLRGDYVPLAMRPKVGEPAPEPNPAPRVMPSSAPVRPGGAGVVKQPAPGTLPGPDGFTGTPGGMVDVPDIATIEAMQRMTVRMTELVPPGASAAQAADGYMILGQEQLAQGRYLSAEQAFDQVLARRAKDPMARVGRLHAQLGSSMFLSAGLELRYLLADHPELLPVRYDAKLLMPRARADTVVELMQEQAQSSPGTIMAQQAGLLVAYLGYQFQHAPWVEQGLTILRAQGATDPGAQALHQVVEKVWRVQAQQP
jgi:hypothetical protein